MPSSSQLLLFLDVVQQGSFTKAAALHDMDNSSLSKQIKKLEHELGVQLLNRSTRSFSLTSAGEEIYEQALQVKNSLDTIKLIADAYQFEPKGILRITSPIYFGSEYLQPVITQFMRMYPEIQVVHVLNDKKSDIISDNFDLAFRIGKLLDSNLIAKKIADTRFILIASKAFIRQHGDPTSPEELIRMPAVVYGNDDITLDQLRINHAVGSDQYTTHRMRPRYKVSDVKTLIHAVTDGLGYALVDLSNLNQSLDESNLIPLLPDHHISTMDTAIYAIYPHRKHTKLARMFIEAVQEHIGDPARWEAYLPSR
ncbi:LysR family transcriptional regulator [Vibrio sp. 10N.286.49.B3]|uniref:LysR family transcriptional regulator n=1 Tax=Vibrio sp. 10N.286.49.B3 TaxID=1880855 RepID=UPI000C84832A|nr:LysR family transcriptional regulator [Vibrio sp. 10N.286.49.B3]PMH44793.1 LysR family transcriptional regulator [Vibrio sp. 10N.286.49.B3]